MDIFLDKELTIERLTRIAGTDKFTMQTFGSTYRCNLQGATVEETQMIGGQIGSVFNCFVRNCPVDIGDRIIIENTNYRCKGIRNSEFALFDFKKLILVKED